MAKTYKAVEVAAPSNLRSEQAGMPGELIYEHAVQIKQVTEYGLAFDRLLSGAAAPPAEGARFDLQVEGTVTGPKLKGTVKGVEHLNVRADGHLQLHSTPKLRPRTARRSRSSQMAFLLRSRDRRSLNSG
jgi:hypothetical protein